MVGPPVRTTSLAPEPPSAEVQHIGRRGWVLPGEPGSIIRVMIGAGRSPGAGGSDLLVGLFALFLFGAQLPDYVRGSLAVIMLFAYDVQVRRADHDRVRSDRAADGTSS
jgi:hypothetical protein